MKIINNDDHALIFANGSYQLMAGVACAKNHLGNIDGINVILYDMQWHPELYDQTREYAEILKLNVIRLPFEFKKSDNTNYHTYRLRTLLNHILFFCYTRVYGRKNIFLPKLYGSPERAIILASWSKRVFVYDDGSAIYLNPRANLRKLDKALYSFMQRLSRKGEMNIGVYPMKPELLTFETFEGIKTSRNGYADEFLKVILTISAHYQDAWRKELKNNLSLKRTIILALPRLTLTQVNLLSVNIRTLVSAISQSFPDVFFLIKPHPRDGIMDFGFLIDNLAGLENWEMLPKSAWSQSLEVISSSFAPHLILSGWSTIGINEDFFPNVKVMIFDFLSIDTTYYNQETYDLLVNMMKKGGGQGGKTAGDAIEKITAYFLQ